MRFGVALLVAVFGYVGFLGWKITHVPAAPAQPQPRLADLGTIKSDLLVFARAERAFYASVGRYAPMSELRSDGLLSLPPDTRWPYRYTIVMPAPDTFVIVAMSQSHAGERPVALMIDDKMTMREYHPRREAPQKRRTPASTRLRFS